MIMCRMKHFGQIKSKLSPAFLNNKEVVAWTCERRCFAPTFFNSDPKVRTPEYEL